MDFLWFNNFPLQVSVNINNDISIDTQVPWHNFDDLSLELFSPITPTNNTFYSSFNVQPNFLFPFLPTNNQNLNPDTQEDSNYINDLNMLLDFNSPVINNSLINTNFSTDFLTTKFDKPVEITRQRCNNWTSQETQILLSLFLKYRAKFCNIRKHPKFWDIIIEEFRLLGITKSKLNCKNRWKVLKAKFKSLKQHPDPEFKFTEAVQNL